jgi:hypothetical protein
VPHAVRGEHSSDHLRHGAGRRSTRWCHQRQAMSCTAPGQRRCCRSLPPFSA